MSLNACISATADELGLDRKDVREIAEKIEAFKKRKAAEGRLDRLEDDVRQFAKSEAERVKIAAMLKRKQAAVNILKRDMNNQKIAAMRAQGVTPANALLARLVGITTGEAGVRDSAAATRNALIADWLGGMETEFRKKLPHVFALLRKPKKVRDFFDDVVREWRAEGSTQNADARTAAQILAKYAEASRIEANRNGANIGRLDGWGGPQSWDAAKIQAATKAAFVRDMAAELDWNRSFGEGKDEADVAQILSESYENIVLGRGLRLTAQEKGERTGPSNLAKSLEKHRVFHFKDADAYLRVQEKYGRGNVFTGMLDHLQHMARTVANMHAFGPNPQVMVGSILEDLRRSVREGSGSEKEIQKQLKKLDADLDKGTGLIGRSFVEIMGDTYSAHNLSGARWASGARNVETLAKLGGAVFSSFSDMVTLSHRLRYQGQPLIAGYAKAFGALMSPWNRLERRQGAIMAGVFSDSILNEIHGRFGAEDNYPGKMSAAANWFFKWSGLNWWTDTLTNAYGNMQAAWMGEHADVAWDKLDRRYRMALEEYGLNGDDWAKVGKMVAQEGDYRFIWPERVDQLPDEMFGSKPREIERNRRDLELKLRMFYSDSANSAVIHPDDRIRAITTQGQQRGTPIGEVWRFMSQFKSFPIAYTQRILIPAIRGRGAERQRDFGGIAHLIVMSTIFGYASMTSKDWIKNRTMKDPTNPETWAAAFLQGGGLGIAGDFLFSKNDRFGGGMAAKAVGPFPGTVFDGIELYQDMTRGDAKAGDAFYFAINNTPFANLWWLRAGLDFAVLNQFQEYLSPGTLRRREGRIKKDFGQRYIVDPLVLQKQGAL